MLLWFSFLGFKIIDQPYVWDDLYHIRSFSLSEIIHSWTDNWFQHDIETPSYRPIAILFYGFLGTVFGESIILLRLFIFFLMFVLISIFYLSLTKIGFTKKPLSKKEMIGNNFKINISDCSDELSSFTEHNHILNFYGYQRFGSKRPVTHLIGKAILHRDFDKAVDLILSFTSDWLFPTNENKEIVKKLNFFNRNVSFTEIETDKGHDSFLLDEPELDLTISGFLDSNFIKLQDK